VDRALLAVAARALPRDRWASFCVTPQTLLRWYRELVSRKWAYSSKRTGRQGPPHMLATTYGAPRRGPLVGRGSASSGAGIFPGIASLSRPSW
jgi:hypothetical protein